MKSGRPLLNCAALGGIASRGVCSERLGAPKKPGSVASSPGGPRRGAFSSAGSGRRGSDQPFSQESSTTRCNAGHERWPRLVQNGKLKNKSLLTPELRDFIDRVIVPILVKEYLAATGQQNELAKTDSDAANSGQQHCRTGVRTLTP